MLTAPDINQSELRQISGTIGAILALVAGIILLLQVSLSVDFAPPRGWQRADADVIVRAQRGIRVPEFSLLLRYYVPPTSDNPQEVRSTQIVPYEAFASLREGDTIPIFYNGDDIFEWRLVQEYSHIATRDYSLAILLIAFSVFALIFPTILRIGARDDDFVFDDAS